jgi:hypothetical protein
MKTKELFLVVFRLMAVAVSIYLLRSIFYSIFRYNGWDSFLLLSVKTGCFLVALSSIRFAPLIARFFLDEGEIHQSSEKKSLSATSP